MTELETTKHTGGPQAMLRGLMVVVVLALVAGLGLFGYTHMKNNGPGKGPDGPQQVGMLDSDAIYAMPEFTKTKGELEELSKSYQKQLTDQIQAKKASPEEAEQLRLQMRDKLEQETAKRTKPLNDRVTAAIAALANERHYKVVLDKRIVVTGVTDITDDVKKKFATTTTADVAKETTDTDCHVGYINQEAIGELTMFKQENAKMAEQYNKLGEEYAKKAKSLSAADQEKMRADMARDFQAQQESDMKPLNDKVNEAITEVAREKGLSLVLNSHHIMWGGRNLTDDVMKKIITSSGTDKTTQTKS